MFHSFMPFAAGLDSLADSATKFVDIGYIFVYSFLLMSVAFTLQSVVFITISIYDRCSWNRPPGSFLIEIIKCSFLSDFVRVRLGRKRFVVNTTNPRSDFNGLAVEERWYYLWDDCCRMTLKLLTEALILEQHLNSLTSSKIMNIFLFFISFILIGNWFYASS